MNIFEQARFDKIPEREVSVRSPRGLAAQELPTLLQSSTSDSQRSPTDQATSVPTPCVEPAPRTVPWY